jgi:hypothetical protein
LDAIVVAQACNQTQLRAVSYETKASFFRHLHGPARDNDAVGMAVALSAFAGDEHRRITNLFRSKQ